MSWQLNTKQRNRVGRHGRRSIIRVTFGFSSFPLSFPSLRGASLRGHHAAARLERCSSVKCDISLCTRGCESGAGPV
jgi:hypothetical protein